MEWRCGHLPPLWNIPYAFSNNIINGKRFRDIMATQYSQLTENEREWFEYFMESYSKDQMIIKYIQKIKELNIAQGGRDGILYD